MSKNARHAFFAFLGCIATSCDPPPRERSTARIQELSPIVSDSLALPVRVATLHDYIIVADAALDPALHVISAVDAGVIASLGPKGEGPHEFENIRGLAANAWDDAVWAFDASRQRLTRIALHDGTVQLDSMVSVRTGQPVTQAVWVGEDLIGVGLFEEGRFAVIDPQSGTVREFVGPVPSVGDSASPRIAQQAYQAELHVRPGRAQVVALTRHADRLEFYDLDRDSSWIVSGPDGFGPRFTLGLDPDMPAFSTDLDLRFGYIDAAPTADYLIALYSGKTRREARGQANFGQRIRVFDWEGKLVGEVGLERPVIGIGVDEERDVLYAVTHEPMPAIVRLVLSEILPPE